MSAPCSRSACGLAETVHAHHEPNPSGAPASTRRGRPRTPRPAPADAEQARGREEGVRRGLAAQVSRSTTVAVDARSNRSLDPGGLEHLPACSRWTRRPPCSGRRRARRATNAPSRVYGSTPSLADQALARARSCGCRRRARFRRSGGSSGVPPAARSRARRGSAYPVEARLAVHVAPRSRRSRSNGRNARRSRRRARADRRRTSPSTRPRAPSRCRSGPRPGRTGTRGRDRAAARCVSRRRPSRGRWYDAGHAYALGGVQEKSRSPQADDRRPCSLVQHSSARDARSEPAPRGSEFSGALVAVAVLSIGLAVHCRHVDRHLGRQPA